MGGIEGKIIKKGREKVDRRVKEGRKDTKAGKEERVQRTEGKEK